MRYAEYKLIHVYAFCIVDIYSVYYTVAVIIALRKSSSLQTKTGRRA